MRKLFIFGSFLVIATAAAPAWADIAPAPEPSPEEPAPEEPASEEPKSVEPAPGEPAPEPPPIEKKSGCSIADGNEAMLALAALALLVSGAMLRRRGTHGE